MTPDEELILQAAEKRFAKKRAALGLLQDSSGVQEDPDQTFVASSGFPQTGTDTVPPDSDTDPRTDPRTDASTGLVPGSLTPEAMRSERVATPVPESRPDAEWWIEGLGPNERPEIATERSLKDFVIAAAQRNHEALMRLLNDEGLTSGDRELYRSPTRVLVGLLKSRDEFQDLGKYKAVNLFEDVLSEIFPGLNDPWLGSWNSGEQFVPSTDTFGNLIDPREDFIFNWAEWRLGEKPMVLDGVGLGRAEDLAQSYPVQSSTHQSVRDRQYLRVISLCFWLARLQENLEKSPRFFLSVRDAGKFGGCSHPTAGKLLTRARQDGLIELQKKEARRKRQAQEFSFNFAKIHLFK